MSLLNDKQIAELCSPFHTTVNNLPSMIAPYEPQQVRTIKFLKTAVVSYGQSSAGYDIRLDSAYGLQEMQPRPNIHRVHSDLIVDPKNFDKSLLVESYLHHSNPDDGQAWWEIYPHSYALGLTLEYFEMPNDVVGICLGKSTYARCGIIINCSPLEPGWRGHLVVEIANTTPFPARIYANEGIAQIMFHKLDSPVATSYADRGGKYQDQQEIVLAKV